MTRTQFTRRTIIGRTIVGIVVIAAGTAAVIGGRTALDRLDNDDTVIEAAPEVNTATAEVRDLSESFTATGTLQFDEPVAVTTPAAGTVLELVDVGDTLANGDVIAVIDTQAVVWLDGAVPAWRSLASGDEGVDVLQLETALTALGFNNDGDVTIDEDYTSTTAAMVKDWQASLEQDETGRIELGTIVFGGERARVATVDVLVGASVSNPQQLISLGADSRYATLQAAPDEAATLAVGDPAAIELPDRSQIDGVISALATGSDTWDITVTFPGDVGFPSTDVTNVEMSWSTEIAGDVLTIPSSALLRLDNASYVVDVVGDDGSANRTPVTVGIVVGTRAEITSGLSAGDIVRSL